MTTVSPIWEVIVPCMMNDHPVRTRHHKEWDKVVRKKTGGLTITKPARGSWVDPHTGDVHEERVIPVRIACDYGTLLGILEFTKVHYNQVAVFAYKISDTAITYR